MNMAPNAIHLSSQLRQIIYYHLENQLVSNALFCAGRLHAIDPRNPDAVHLLALCHYRAGQFKAAYDYSRSLGRKAVSLGCTYIFAQACLALGRNGEGIAALEQARHLWRGDSNQRTSDAPRRYIPDAAAVNNILGRLLLGIGDVKRAAEYFVEALALNPFMWDAFESLCDTGTGIRTSNIFRSDAQSVALLVASYISTPSSSDDEASSDANGTTSQPFYQTRTTGGPSHDPFGAPRNGGEIGLSSGSVNGLSKMNIGRFPAPGTESGYDANGVDPYERQSSEFDTHDPSEDMMGAAEMAQSEPPNAPVRKPRPLQVSAVDAEFGAKPGGPSLLKSRVKGNLETGESHNSHLTGTHKRTISGSNPIGTAQGGAMGAPQRRSIRIFNRGPSSAKATAATSSSNLGSGREVKKARGSAIKGRVFTSTTVGREVSGNRNAVEVNDIVEREYKPASMRPEQPIQGSKTRTADVVREHEAMQWLLDLFGRLGRGHFELSRFQCQNALDNFQSVAPQQRDTPWVLGQIGRAYFEQGRYGDAEKTFARIKKMAPSRIEDMEVYSTVLWHLKNDTELAFLSHELVESNRLAPESWCTIGNSFSLQRDHDQALKCFKRATQLAPKFAYGFTLQGHEHMANEEYEKALLDYRKAISVDHRHYNGWYGLGKVYEKLGQYDMAEKHYRSAAYINPTNSILVTCIGVVLEKLKKPQAALGQYHIACQLAPSSAISRFKKARVLLHMNCPREALAELKELVNMVPDESNVHFMLGRVYKILHDKSNAVKCFTIAMNLDPKAQQHIKEVMEALDESEEEMEDDQDMS